MKASLKIVSYLGYLVLISFILLELALRIYNPFPNRIKGGRIELKKNYTTTYYNEIGLRGIADTLTVHRNSLGLRGEELCEQEGITKIIAVGGSTTECIYIGEGKTWPDLLQEKLRSTGHTLWINNAGLDGHSTYGHLVLMEDYILSLKPDYVLFLVGCNDVGRDDIGEYDKKQFAKPLEEQNWKERLMTKSEVVNTYFNLRRAGQAREKFDLGHGIPDGRIPMDLQEAEEQEMIADHAKFIDNFGSRLEALINLCQEHGIQPILITQPTLAKESYWRLLDAYNEKTREVGLSYGIPVIDLATNLPKEEKYLYDTHHFTQAGCEWIAQFLQPRIGSIIESK